jgi:conjugal transfer pilus assembly protein TraB
MNLNENLKTRRKQLAILAAVIVGGAAATGGVIWYGQHQQEQKQPAPVATPNMTGVVTAAFNQQVNDAALQQQQAKTSELEDKLATLTQQFAQNKLTTEQQLAKKDEEIQRLNDQLTKAPGSNQTTGQQTPPAGQNGTPLPGPVAAGQARPPEYTVTPAGTPAATGVNMGQGAAFYPGGSGQRMTGGLSTTKFSYESLKKKPTKLPWIPSGSFSDAIMIEGADANASVTGQQNTQPVTIRLLGNIQMPNNKEYSADGCFVVGEIWGDISSERGIVRTKSISCVLKKRQARRYGIRWPRQLPGYINSNGGLDPLVHSRKGTIQITATPSVDNWIKGQQDALTNMKEDLQSHPAGVSVLPQPQQDLIKPPAGRYRCANHLYGGKRHVPGYLLCEPRYSA